MKFHAHRSLPLKRVHGRAHKQHGVQEIGRRWQMGDFGRLAHAGLQHDHQTHTQHHVGHGGQDGDDAQLADQVH